MWTILPGRRLWATGIKTVLVLTVAKGVPMNASHTKFVAVALLFGVTGIASARVRESGVLTPLASEQTTAPSALVKHVLKGTYFDASSPVLPPLVVQQNAVHLRPSTWKILSAPEWWELSAPIKSLSSHRTGLAATTVPWEKRASISFSWTEQRPVLVQ
jgi:hypothetical protein